jgi:hypothetical protein
MLSQTGFGGGRIRWVSGLQASSKLVVGEHDGRLELARSC